MFPVFMGFGVVPQGRPMTKLEEMSRNEWLALADEAELTNLVTAPARNDLHWNVAFVSLGPKFYAERLMQRVAKQHGAKLTALKRKAKVTNPATNEPNHLYVATFKRLYA
jgi:hypothetical protein